MKRIVLTVLLISSALALFFFLNKNETPKQSTREDKSSKEIEIKPKSPVDSQQETKTKKIVSPTDNKENLPSKKKSTVKQSPEITKLKKTIIKRNRHFKNSEFEFVSKDSKSNRSVFIIKSISQGKRYSFSSLVDNKTGKILKTWGRTIIENRE
ncbi:MAG: hypothetical protein BM556_00070 [Bacteriovorax sp. MedPE-SWde]|nr:MAG: hypothetical protein BM556_00070 [Bacteriovorax sp. MedPE-SWde]